MDALLSISLTTCFYSLQCFFFILEKEVKYKINTLRSYFLAEVKKQHQKMEIGENISTKVNGRILNR